MRLANPRGQAVLLVRTPQLAVWEPYGASLALLQEPWAAFSIDSYTTDHNTRSLVNNVRHHTISS